MTPGATLSLAVLCTLAGVAGAPGQSRPSADPLAPVIAAAQQRVVKLYGAAIGREKAYGSGVIVSSDGKIVTVLSVLLEGRGTRVVLPDGRALVPRILARDEVRQLALLKVEAENLPFFELSDSRGLEPGDWVIATANPFKVADGPEPVSASIGTLAGRANLAGRHRARDFTYEGPVLLTDVIVTAPGCAGGALVDAGGRLVGVIGRAVVSRYTNTWINYALPVEEVARLVSGETPLSAVAPTAALAGSPHLPNLGIHLFDVGGRVRPAYIERVRPESPAWKAGLRPNDLIVSVDNQAVATCADYVRLVARLRRDQQVTLVVKRGEEIKVFDLTVGTTRP